MKTGTWLLTKKKFIQFLEENVPDDKIIAYTNMIHGTHSAPSKRIPFFRISVAWAQNAFKKTFGLMQMMQVPLMGIVVVEKSNIPPEELEHVGRLTDEVL